MPTIMGEKLVRSKPEEIKNGSFTILPGIASIGEKAFEGCTSLTSVTIPNGVTSIGKGAFDGCTSLTSVTIPNGVTSIGKGAFKGCTGLTSVTISNGVTSIDVGVFFGCTGLTSVTIPDGVTSIGQGAFSGCTSLTSATIPHGVTSIGKGAFDGCTSLTSATIPHGVTSIGEWAFFGCGLTSATIPHGVTSIGMGVFEGCTSLTSVTIPHGVTSIGQEAFRDCTSLTSATIPDGVTSIGKGAFQGCTSLTSATIPHGVTSIGEWAFFGCTGLTSATIPHGVTSIGMGAFEGCTNIERVALDKPAANKPDADGLTLLDRVIRSGAPANLIKAMIAAGVYFTDAGLAWVTNNGLKLKIKTWGREYQRAALYEQALEIFYAHHCELEGFAAPNISNLPPEIWCKILYLDARSHPDFPLLEKRDLLEIRQQLEGGVSVRLQEDVAALLERATKQSVLYGYSNKTLRRLTQLGQQQADEARLHDWKRAGGSTAIVPKHTEVVVCGKRKPW